jgi:DNA-binding SARP family transcriptional activator
MSADGGRSAAARRNDGVFGASIAVLGGFRLWVGEEQVNVPGSSERVLAFVALCCRAAVPRAMVAGALWPDAPEHCAHANLRSALARLRSTGRQALEVSRTEVGLARQTSVDLHRLRPLAHRLIDPDMHLDGLDLDVVEDFSADLLPGWYDDWALLEAEDWRQLRIHALEALAAHFLCSERHAEAVAAACAAVRADPLREISQSWLIRGHLAEGSPSEALRDFEHYARRLHDELGLQPTSRLCRLVAACTGLRPRHGRLSHDRPAAF